MIDQRVGIVGGAGWLGSAIAKSLVSSGTIDPARLICSYRSKQPAEPTPWRWTSDSAELVASSDIVVISVRPADWPALSLEAGDRLVISVMAGIPMAELAERTGARRLARALPNAAAEVGASYTPVLMKSDRPDDAAIVRTLFEACGAVDMVSNEDHLDYLTTLSGSGPAFPALLAEAMIAGALERGISPETARRAALQTLVGAGRLFEALATVPAEVVRTFVAYEGTTAAAIRRMSELGFADAVRAGLDAAYLKAKTLSGRR